MDEEHGKMDFKLINIAIITGFYINIVFKAKLRAIMLWVHGFDYILRFGNLEHNIIIKKLKRKFNLILLKYKVVFYLFYS